MSAGRFGLAVIGVLIEAGQTQFTFRPLVPYSTARVLENALMPPFEALYAAVHAWDPNADEDETFTINPCVYSSIGRA